MYIRKPRNLCSAAVPTSFKGNLKRRFDMPVHRHSPKNSITQSRLKKLLKYNPETGSFVQIGCRPGAKKGSRAGTVGNTGYNVVKINGRTYLGSRLAFLYMEGYWPENDMDHINRIRDDDRWCNLRHVSGDCNRRNSNVMKNNTSGVNGVCKSQRGWCVRISSLGRQIWVGRFKTFHGAVVARRKAEIKYGYDSCNSETSAAKYIKQGE